MKLSVVIPAYNEEECIADTVEGLLAVLQGQEHEILVVDDGSSDATADRVAAVAARGNVRCIRSPYPHGFGYAVRAGLEHFTGDAVAIVMADGSDDPRDVLTYLRLLEDGYDCAFGSRFIPGAAVHDYPHFKFAVNRIVNFGIRVLFRHGFNDTTNAFKAYRRDVIESVQPLLSPHFNLTVELPLKAIVRGHSYAVAPVHWRNREKGASKLKLQEMGSRYLFIVLYVWLEHHFSRGDYRLEPLRGRRPSRLRPSRIEQGSGPLQPNGGGQPEGDRARVSRTS